MRAITPNPAVKRDWPNGYVLTEVWSELKAARYIELNIKPQGLNIEQLTAMCEYLN